MKSLQRTMMILIVVVPALAVAQQDFRIAFITRNAYGNNLYLDNITAGHRHALDAGAVTIQNIPPDTVYTTDGGPTTIAPAIVVVNAGSSAITAGLTVTLSASPGGYSSTRTVPSLSAGRIAQIVMDDLTIPPSTPLNFTVATHVAADEDRTNDTLKQSTLFFPGARRKVLLEEWTSSTCGPCASNNPTVDAFIAAKADSLVAVKYHVGWPSPGDDPMYLYNAVQSYDRRYYYGVSSVPHVIMDGVVTPEYPYTTPSSLPAGFAARQPLGSPLSITIEDSMLAGDSLQARVVVTVHSPLRAGVYRLRVQAVERHIVYATAPGTNGEAEFYEVFRGAYPNSTGTALTTSPGTYVFTFRYRQAAPALRDSLFTIAYVQNDITREVLNAGTSFTGARLAVPAPAAVTKTGSRERCLSSDTPAQLSSRLLPEGADAEGGFRYELFERGFPPAGWRLSNPDAGVTLERFPGVNGPSFGGTVGTRIDFYNYSGSGQTDTLFSPVITGLLPTDSLTFDWAHAQYPGYADRLIVKVSTNGGVTFDSTVFDRSGALLATAPSTTDAFIPLSSEWMTFRLPLSGLVHPAPVAPDLASPPNGATGLSVTSTLVWHPSPGAATYRLQVATDSGFASITYADSALTDTLKTLPAQPAGTTLFWRVRGKSIYGSGPWSAIRRYSTAAFLTTPCPVTASWNLVALPLTVSDPRRSVLFPASISDAYAFNTEAGYVRRDSLLNGTGYWLKFPEPGSVLLSGYERTADTVEVVAGWNLIGSVTVPLPVSTIEQHPAGILVSSLYRYSSGYQPVDTLQPAQGYWVKAAGPGSIILFSPVPGVKRSRTR